MARLWRGTFAAMAVLGLGLSMAEGGPNWPRWRGPLENGHSEELGLPVAFEAKDIVTKVPLQGIGQSSPVVWGEKVFLTSALDSGKKRVVFCLDRTSGKTLWEHVAWTGEPEPSHVMNGWASATCVTDGEVVVAFFGKGGLHGYSVDGKLLWSKNLGPFESPWGVASCPIIVGDLLIQAGDADKDAFIAAFNKKTGEQVWSTPRPNNRGWSTPILIDAAGRQELVVNGHAGVMAYDPKTGKELWFCKSFNGRGEPTVTPAGGLLCAVNGLSGDVYAIKPGGTGDVTKTHMAWHTPRKTNRDCPSPIVIGDSMLIMDMKGIVTCYQPSTGTEVWKHRIGGNFSASPIAANGLAYFIGEDGTVIAIKPGSEPNIVAQSKIAGADGELFRASITPCEGQLLIRSTTNLYVVGERKSAK